MRVIARGRTDIDAIIRALHTDARLSVRADPSRFGLVGHSLGGYTALGLAGAWPDWKLDGVRAVLALSPYSQPFIVRQTLAGIAVPVMYQGGSRDFGITPALRKNSGAYEQSRSAKYYVEFQNAGHFAWTDLSAVDHEAIAAYAIAFMNHYVKGASADPLLTRATADVAELRFASELGASDAGGSSTSR
ncbi:MAG: alpha/beta hydrolase family protein [Steroidobacterales bacterium]